MEDAALHLQILLPKAILIMYLQNFKKYFCQALWTSWNLWFFNKKNLWSMKRWQVIPCITLSLGQSNYINKDCLPRLLQRKSLSHFYLFNCKGYLVGSHTFSLPIYLNFVIVPLLSSTMKSSRKFPRPVLVLIWSHQVHSITYCSRHSKKPILLYVNFIRPLISKVYFKMSMFTMERADYEY